MRNAPQLRTFVLSEICLLHALGSLAPPLALVVCGMHSAVNCDLCGELFNSLAL